MSDLVVRPATNIARPVRTFNTLLVGTLMCERALCDATLTELQNVTGWLFGDELWSWEMAYPPIRQAARAEGYRQFPSMPSAAEAMGSGVTDYNLKFAVLVALDSYGPTLEVARGPHKRNGANGFDTFDAIVGSGGHIRMPMMIRRGQRFA